MIKKVLLIILIVFTNFLFANTKDNIDGLLNKTNSLALGHIALIEDRSIISTNYTSIISYGYLDSNFTSDNFFGGNISYTSNNTSIEINTNILSSNLTIDEKEYFLAHYNNAINGRTIYEKAGYIYVLYFYPKKAISIILNKKSQNEFNKIQNEYIGNAVPTSYITPTIKQRWWDSNDVLFNVKQYINGSFSNEDYTNQNLLYNGSFSNINTIPLVKTSWDFTKVITTENSHEVRCDTGANYNQIAQRCEAYTSNACDGNSFDSLTGKCYIKPLDYCKANGFDGYDETSNRCWKYVYSAKITSYDYKPYLGFMLGSYIQWNTSTTSKNRQFVMWRGTNSNPECWNGWKAEDFTDRHYYQRPNSDCVSLLGKFQADGMYWTCMNSSAMGTQCPGTSPKTSCPSGYSNIGTECRKTILICPATHPTDVGNGQCRAVQYANHISNINGYTFSNNGMNGTDAYVKTPNCNGKKMSVYPYYPTPHNGNNGLCYSDVGLYCKNTGGLSYDGIYTCYKTNQRCDTAEYMIAYNYSGTNDKCTKQDYSCSVGALYGLATHPSNSNTTDLFNRIISKETKAETNAIQLLLGNDVIVNDNQGSMCVGFKTTTFTQDVVSPDYTINGIQKSGF